MFNLNSTKYGHCPQIIEKIPISLKPNSLTEGSLTTNTYA